MLTTQLGNRPGQGACRRCPGAGIHLFLLECLIFGCDTEIVHLLPFLCPHPETKAPPGDCRPPGREAAGCRGWACPDHTCTWALLMSAPVAEGAPKETTTLWGQLQDTAGCGAWLVQPPNQTRSDGRVTWRTQTGPQHTVSDTTGSLRRTPAHIHMPSTRPVHTSFQQDCFQLQVIDKPAAVA